MLMTSAQTKSGAVLARAAVTLASMATKRGARGVYPETAARLREMVEDLLKLDRYQGNLTRFAESIGITQPGVTRIRQGGGVGLETAVAIARLYGTDPRELLAKELGVGVSTTGRFPGLEVCLAYHSARWSQATIAAARGGAFETDAEPAHWPARLDKLEGALRKLK